jgi:hypothetical protein
VVGILASAAGARGTKEHQSRQSSAVAPSYLVYLVFGTYLGNQRQRSANG